MGTIRSLLAAQRRYEREERKKQRDLERQRKLQEKMEEQERARYEVDVYENYIEVLTSIHKDVGATWDWQEILQSNPPSEPQKLNTAEKAAKKELDNYKPGIGDKLLRRGDKKRDDLEHKIEDAKEIDEDAYQDTLGRYRIETGDWELAKELAKGIMARDPNVMMDAVKTIDPFVEIREHGSSIEFNTEDGRIGEIRFEVLSEEVIPRETKTILKSGKLSLKNMPKTKFYELYQDYVCGCILRMAREIFAVLPIKIIIITAFGELLNTKTGYKENAPILSVAVPMETSRRLNYDMLDPSDSMGNFVHNMKFMKTKGFQPIEKLSAGDLDSR
jgi:hypothetical protein